MKSPEQQAKELWSARDSGGFCAPLDSALSMQDAYDIQNAITKTAAAGATIVGYKVGATATETLGILGLEGPFYGPLFSNNYTANVGEKGPIELPLFIQHQSRIEAEFVVCMKNDITRGDTDVTIEDVENNIEWVAPGLEIVGSRFKDAPAHIGHAAIADHGGNQHMLIGTPYKAWSELDLNAHPVKMDLEGQNSVEGHSGISLFGNPLHFVSWVLNQPAMKDIGLKAGQFVSCGTCTGAPFLEVDKRVTVDYGVLGKLELDIVQRQVTG